MNLNLFNKDLNRKNETQNKIPNNEVKPLTSIRGIAAIYVMLYHFLGHSFTSNSVLGSVLHHGYISVDLFFILSGFVIFFSYHGRFGTLNSIQVNFYEFLVKRFARVYPLYFVVTIYAFLMHKFVITGATHRNYDTFELITNLMLIQNWGLSQSIGGPTWSLSLEWAAYILFPISCYFIATSKRFKLNSILAFSLIAILVAAYFPREISSVGASGPLDLTSFKSIFPVLRCLGEFTLGMSLYKVMQAESIVKLFSKPNLDVAIVILISLCLPFPALDVVVVLLFALLILSLLINNKTLTYQLLDTKALWWLGAISYSIYLVHGRFAKFVDGLSNALYPLFGSCALFAAVIILTLAVISVASFSYLTIEIHGRTLLQKILLRKRPI